MNRRPYDPGAQAQARTIYLAHGPARASEVTGVPERTIRRWAAAGHWRPQPQPAGHGPDQGVAGVAGVGQRAGATHKSGPRPPAPRSLGWHPRAVLARIAAELAAELDDLAACRTQGRRREAQAVAITVGILTDKALALAKASGHDPAGGHLDPEASVERLNELLDVWRDRCAWAAAHPEDDRHG